MKDKDIVLLYRLRPVSIINFINENAKGQDQEGPLYFGLRREWIDGQSGQKKKREGGEIPRTNHDKAQLTSWR